MQNFIKTKHHRSHPVRLSAVALAFATVFHVSGLGHFSRGNGHNEVAAVARAYANHMERENETARHAIRLDETLRLPTISGI